MIFAGLPRCSVARARPSSAASWFGFIGFMVVQASQAAYRQSRAESSLDRRDGGQPHVVAHDLDPRRHHPAQGGQRLLPRPNARCLPVQDDYGNLQGLICLSDLQRTDQSAWGVDQVQDVMTGAERLQTVAPDDPAAAALHRLATTDVEQLAVVQDGRLLGFVDRTSVARYLQTGGRTDGRAAARQGRPARAA